MSENQNSPFSKLHVEEITQAKRTLLDELNLPPKVTKLIRDNAKLLQNIITVAVVVICAWTAYDYYQEKKLNDSSAMLAQALRVEQAQARATELEKVRSEYPGSGAALWAQVALAHEQLDAGDHAKAKELLAALLGKANSDDPIYPLLLLDVAQASELSGEHADALSRYAALREIPGFAQLGYLGEARMYEATKDLTRARETYEKVNTLTDLSPATRQWVEAKLAGIK